MKSFFAEKVKYRFFNRKNGVSTGVFDSLNCSVKVGDDPKLVRENMRRVAQHLGCTVEKIFVLHQTHSSIVIPVLSNEPFLKTPYGDALVTNTSGVFLGIKTADCAPVLFADEKNSVIGACHAGWRGAVGGVIENTLNAMLEIGAEIDSISAVVGPCISLKSYEVGDDMKQEFLQSDSSSDLFFVPTENQKYHFDLPGYVVSRLKKFGIKSAEWCEEDTYSQQDLYFSHRYSSKQGHECGRQISVIGLRG